jgi:hypothetical protein
MSNLEQFGVNWRHHKFPKKRNVFMSIDLKLKTRRAKVYYTTLHEQHKIITHLEEVEELFLYDR